MHGHYLKAKDLLFRNISLLQDNRISKRIDQGLKETALKCFVLLYKSEIKSLSIEGLKERFNLEGSDIRKLVNQLILDGSLSARWNSNQLERIDSNRNAISKRAYKLQENLETITQNNLRLMQYATRSNIK